MDDDLPFDDPLSPERKAEHDLFDTVFREFQRWLLDHPTEVNKEQIEAVFFGIAERQGLTDAEAAARLFDRFWGTQPEE